MFAEQQFFVPGAKVCVWWERGPIGNKTGMSCIIKEAHP